MNRGRPEATGYLYLELLVTLTIFGLAVVSVAPLFVIAARQSAASRDLSVATNLTRAKADGLETQSYSTLASGSDTVTVGAMQFGRNWRVDRDVPWAGMATVTVTARSVRERLTQPARAATLSFYRVP